MYYSIGRYTLIQTEGLRLVPYSLRTITVSAETSCTGNSQKSGHDRLPYKNSGLRLAYGRWHS